jgi:hypothetical protein
MSCELILVTAETPSHGRPPGVTVPALMRAKAPRAGQEDFMATEELNQELWALAVENVRKQKDEAFESLFDEAVEEHVNGDDCSDCEDGLCPSCEDRIASGIENWQENQFDYQAEAEYDRLEQQQEEQEEENEEEER